MAGFPVTRAGAILAVSDFEASLAFYRDRLGLEVEAVYDDPPYATLSCAGARISLAEQGHPAEDRPGVAMTAPADRSQAAVVLVLEVADALAVARRARGRGRGDARAAVQPAVGRLPLLLRRPRRLPRRDRAAGMRAVVLRAPGDVGVDTVPDPAILDPGDAIVQVSATAICGADLFPFHGFTPGFENGTILGHEFVGTVVEAGRRRPPRPHRAARRVHEHDLGRHLRALPRGPRLPVPGAGAVRLLRRLPAARRRPGRARPRAGRRSLPALDDAIPDEAAIFCADILPTGYASVVRGGVEVGDTVVVLGCGPVGLMAVLCAVGIAGRVIAVDGIADRRGLAERLGAESVDPAAAEDVVLWMRPPASAPTS